MSSGSQDSNEQGNPSVADFKRLLTEFQRVTGALADGDLTQRLALESDTPLVAEVTESVNDDLDELEADIAAIKGLTDAVADTSEDVAGGTATAINASEQAANRTEDIEVSTSEQKQRLETASVEMQALSASVEEVAASAATVAETASETRRRGEEGQNAANEALEEAGEIQSITDQTADRIDGLEAKVDEIEEVVDLISSVAKQTNLLALNAKIEAAHAGEAGDGFAIVANNVQELATETMEAVDRITAVVDDIQVETDRTVDDIGEMQDTVSGSVETIERALEALSDIGDHIVRTNHGIQEINDAAEQQAKSSQRISMSIEEITELGKDVNEQGEDVAASVKEQTRAVSDLTDDAFDVLTYAETLETLLSDLNMSERAVLDPEALVEDAAAERKESMIGSVATEETGARQRQTSMATVANLDNSYWLSWAKGYREAADELGYRTRIEANNGDVDTQRAQFERALNDDIDAIVGQTFTNDSIVELASMCVDAGVPTVLAVTTADWFTPWNAGDEYVQFFAPDFVTHAYAAAKLLFEAMGGEGGFVHIEGNRGTAPNIGRNAGVDLALQEYPDIELLGPRREGNFLRGPSQKAMRELVSEHGEAIQGFFAQNDSIAEGGISVFKDEDIEVPIVGIDASEQALTRVRNGEMAGSVSGMGPWQAAWSLAKVHDYRHGHKLSDAERMMTFTAPICVQDPDLWTDRIDAIPVVDATQYKQDVFHEETPFDWKKMSVVESGDDWDPQIKMRPIRKDDFETLLGWTSADKPAGYSLPDVFDDESELDRVERLYADQFTNNPLTL